MAIKKLCPFKLWTLQNFPFIAEDFDALTNYELMCKIVEYLNNVINVTNEQTSAINYMKDYFDNLDVQDEINNKLDEMASDGTLEEIISSYLNTNALITFNTLSDLKSATNLINGSKVKTLGYHTLNDNGGALYIVRNVTNEDVVNEMNIIALNNESLVAELIIEEVINVKQLGAYGDTEHDDIVPLQFALSNYKEINIPYGNYLISEPLVITGREISVYGEEAMITYNGNDYVIDIPSLVNSTIRLSNIYAENGECIYIHSDENDHNTAYVNFYLKYLTANENKNCIKCSINSVSGYCNEVHFYDGRFRAGKNGLLLETNNNTDIDGWRFNNIDVEGVSNGFELNAGTSYIKDFQILGCRTDELDINNAKLIKTTGNISGMLILTSSLLKASYFDLSTDTTNGEIFGTIRINSLYSTSARIKGGKIYGAINTYPMLDSETDIVPSNANLNDYIVTGTYTLSESVTPTVTNAPNESLANASKLIVLNITTENSPATANTLRIIQYFINRSNLYYRYITKDSGSFNYRNWKKVSTTDLT